MGRVKMTPILRLIAMISFQICCSRLAQGLAPLFSVGPRRRAWTSSLPLATPEAAGVAVTAADNATADAVEATVQQLQTQLLAYGAAYNRGFGASPRARRLVDGLIRRLEALNGEASAARGIGGGPTGDGAYVEEEEDDPTGSAGPSPLTGAWRMVWTTALDVLSLEANPLVTTGAIYQVFDPPTITNVIDFLPRLQSLVPPSVMPSSLLRAQVETRGAARRGRPNRVGLEFRAVRLQPVQALGIDVADRLPPLAVDLPRLPGMIRSEDGPGYFDVTFLDDALLIIRQQGEGLFCLVKVDSIDP